MSKASRKNRIERTQAHGFSFWLGVCLIGALALLACVSFFRTPYDPNAMSAAERFYTPSLAHWMGTDNFGRDIFSRVLVGMRTTFVISASTILIGTVIGTAVGALTGYFGGWIDEILMRINDSLTVFPSILLALVIVSLLGTGTAQLILALGIVFIPSYARVVRSAFIGLRHQAFVKSARLMGASHARIILVHILPNVRGTLLSAIVVGFNNAVLAESSMSYLGLGVQPPDASLGRMLAESQGYLMSAPWYCLFPALTVVLMVMSVVMVSTKGGSRLRGGYRPQPDDQMAEIEILKAAEAAEERIPKAAESAAGRAGNEETASLLRVENLQAAFGAQKVVDGVSFTLHAGQQLGIVGESGSGKSMTALSIMGLLPKEAAYSGHVWYQTENGPVDLFALSAKQRKRYQGQQIAMIYQEPMTSLNPVKRIGTQVEEVLRLHTGLSRRERHQRVLEALSMAELPEPEQICGKYPHELSGGMRQRVMIAMAMICKPAVLIADEPTTALDARVQEQILTLLQRLCSQQKTALILISHDLEVVNRICDSILVLHNGRIVERGSAEAIFQNPKETYTRQLLAATRLPVKQPVRVEGEPILEVKHCALYYGRNRRKRYVQKDLNFSVRKGEILGVAGPSGCGKTTLSMAVLGLHKGYEGSISCKAKQPQMVFQDPYSSLNPVMTVGRILEEPLRIAYQKGTWWPEPGRKKREAMAQRTAQMLKQVGLAPEIAWRSPSALSGGQRQRVSIAAALMLNPEFVIADEPVSALDATVGAQVLELLLKLQKERKLAILFISHDRKVIEAVSDRILEL